MPAVVLFFAAGYYYIRFAQLIDARLAGERDVVSPRVFARPLELRRGQVLTTRQLIDRLNDLGYAQRAHVDKPGEFAIGAQAIAVMPRDPEATGDRVVRVVFQSARRIQQLEVGDRSAETVTLDAPLLSSLITSEREKRRPMALSAIPERMREAVLAIEDRRFYEHPGVDPIGIVGAFVSNLRGRRAYTAGGSTITQQVARNIFLPKLFPGMTLQEAREKSLRRKLLEMYVSVILTRRASKDAILEMYLNDMTLGQRGSFAIVGVAEASRLFFGKDVSNVTLAEAATIAGVYQSPSALSPFNNPARAKDRRNVVLNAMVDAGYVKTADADRAEHEPLIVVQRALESEAPYFVDYVDQTLDTQYPGLTTTNRRAVDVYTTLDLHLQRIAQDAIRNGLARIDQVLSRRRRKGKAEATLIAVDPRTGDILAFVGGRSYNRSQYNRVIVSRRQPGSVFKPFVYLTAFERATEEGRTDVTPATIVQDEPETFEFQGQTWTPENYEGTYDGPVTFRHALAHSRNLATIHVAEQAGFDRVANFWRSLGVGNPPKPYPSIALGVFEATPFEIATAYTLFPNGGAIRPLKHILRIRRGDEDLKPPSAGGLRRVARGDTTYLVTDMMRAVLSEGTGASARANGFTLDAAGKTGTTNDLRDAWFAGFTPELLTVVWVGFDDNQPVGMSGGQAALPIWTEFMRNALAGRPDEHFPPPDDIVFVTIDAETGKLPTPLCPHVVTQAFIAGTEPRETCEGLR